MASGQVRVRKLEYGDEAEYYNQGFAAQFQCAVCATIADCAMLYGLPYEIDMHNKFFYKCSNRRNHQTVWDITERLMLLIQ